MIVSAYIKSISILGDMVIKFSHPMQTTFNLTLYNETIIEMYILPAKDRHLDDGFEGNLNFTWNVTDFYVDEMKIKINFTDPYAISLGIE